VRRPEGPKAPKEPGELGQPGAAPDPSDSVGEAPLRMRSRTGALLGLDPVRWHAPADRSEATILAEAAGTVLDVGCGPGRLVRHLLAQGVTAMGVDSSPGAVARAQERGAPVLQRSVWERLPGEPRRGTVLLFDGNIGIGGDPVALLRRCSSLLGRPGRVLVEVDPPGSPTGKVEVRLERGQVTTPWFPWATVSTEEVADLAARAGLATSWIRPVGPDGSRRWFALLETSGSDDVGPGPAALTGL
jgi:SAM-dependent methyltransferase